MSPAITNLYRSARVSGFTGIGLDMLQGITSRIPAVIANAIHQAVYLGSTYACLSLLAAGLRSLLDLGSGIALKQ